MWKAGRRSVAANHRRWRFKQAGVQAIRSMGEEAKSAPRAETHTHAEMQSTMNKNAAEQQMKGASGHAPVAWPARPMAIHSITRRGTGGIRGLAKPDQGSTSAEWRSVYAILAQLLGLG
jgi:hypothetical protein